MVVKQPGEEASKFFLARNALNPIGVRIVYHSCFVSKFIPRTEPLGMKSVTREVIRRFIGAEVGPLRR